MFRWGVEQGRPAAVALAVPALCWDPYLSHGTLLLSRTVSVDGAPDFALRMGCLAAPQLLSLPWELSKGRGWGPHCWQCPLPLKIPGVSDGFTRIWKQAPKRSPSTNVHSSTVFKSQRWAKSRRPPRDEQANNRRPSTRGLLSRRRKLACATTWRKQGDTRLRHSDSQEVTQCVTPFI